MNKDNVRKITFLGENITESIVALKENEGARDEASVLILETNDEKEAHDVYDFLFRNTDALYTMTRGKDFVFRIRAREAK